MLDLDDKDWQIIKKILQKYPFQFFAFGSRVKHTAKKFSDLDICYKDPIPDAVIVKIEGEFEDSDLPFNVELINWHQCSVDFQKLIEKDLVPL